jgi:GR25 family glycosyltransferase involved in LPS biosynthesis
MIIDDFEFYRITIFRPELINHDDSWKQQGFVVNNIQGITPEQTKENPRLLKMINFKKNSAKGKHAETEFSETEKCITLSHYLLWRKCVDLNKPIAIIEEDAVCIRPFNKVWNVNRLRYFCKAQQVANPEITKFSPAAGYVLTPKGAGVLIKAVKDRNGVNGQVDHYIRKFRDKNSPDWAIDFAIQDPEIESSIVHASTNLSSIHR